MRAFIIYACLFLYCEFYSQGFKVTQTLPNISQHRTCAIFEMSPGVYIGAGFIVDTVNHVPVTRIAITGLGNQGQVLWVKKYGGQIPQYINNPFVARCFYKQKNNIYYAGCVRGANNEQFGVLVKFNLNGDTLWQKFYTDSAVDVVPQMVTGSFDGGFLMTGFFQDWVNHTNPCLIIKTDANGVELWRKKINKTGLNVSDGQAISQDSLSKKIISVGYQYFNTADNYDNILILDSLGVKLTQMHFTHLGGFAKDLILTSDHKAVMVGWQLYPQINSWPLIKSFAVKFDINPPYFPIWRLDGFDSPAAYNTFTCVRELKNGNLLLGGIMDSSMLAPSNPLTRFTTVDKNGNILSNRYYDYKYNDTTEDNNQGVRSVEICDDGGWIAAITCANSKGNNPFLFVKYDSTGCDSSLAYCSTLNLTKIKRNELTNYDFKIYPNPATDILNIELEGDASGKLILLIIDAFGREMKSFPMDQNNKIDLNGLNPGIYILKIKKEKQIIYTSKIIKE